MNIRISVWIGFFRIEPAVGGGALCNHFLEEMNELPSHHCVTSYAMPGDIERAIESGCMGCIEKPINPDTFMGQAEEHLL